MFKKNNKEVVTEKQKGKKTSDIKLVISLLVLFFPFLLIYLQKYIKPKTNKDSEVKPVKLSKPEDRLKDDGLVVLKKGVPVAKSSTGSKGDLSERQYEIYNFIKNNDKVDTSILHAKFKDVTIRTIRRDLNILVEKGRIKKHGETKGVTYSAL